MYVIDGKGMGFLKVMGGNGKFLNRLIIGPLLRLQVNINVRERFLKV